MKLSKLMIITKGEKVPTETSAKKGVTQIDYPAILLIP